ncbi:MAG: DUF5702 domain-containing protein [Lachnospiraceae bacterium]|nr:DUF5702 domain-containing protein [Lachnospiraceae bacterium]
MHNRQERRHEYDKRYRRKHQGIITVFVTLIMVPVVVFTGLFVDLARLKLSGSQAVMAADAYGEAVLSEYQNVLKELYGLFAVTQSEEGLEAIKTLGDYILYSYNPTEGDVELSGFMPYAGADVKLEYTAVENATLGNESVLMTQVAEFMQYRIIEEVVDFTGILDAVEGINNQDADMEATEKVQEIAETSSDALDKIEDYYNQLKVIYEYPSYTEQLRYNGVSYDKKIVEIQNSTEYEEYVYYLENQEDIDDAIDQIEELEAQIEDEEKDGGTAVTTVPQELKDLAGKYVDVDSYTESIKDTLDDLHNTAWNFDSDPVDFYNIEGYLADLDSIHSDLNDTLRTIEDEVKALENQLSECSDETRAGIEQEIEDLNEIVEKAQTFEDVNKYCQENVTKELNRENRENLEEALEALDNKAQDLVNGELEPGEGNLTFSVKLQWHHFYSVYNTFYDWLKEMFSGSEGSSDSAKKEADKKIENAENVLQEKEDALNDETDQREARDISSDLASTLGIVDGKGVEEDDALSLPDGFSLEKSLDRFLMASYDFGMFSSRVSGLEESDQPLYGVYISSSDSSTSSSSDSDSDDNADYSLTKVKMSTDINYLYGAELEYLLAGHISSKDNQNAARNEINAIRMALNLVSTYKISAINSTINTIANEAAAAVAATAVGAPAAPLVRIAVSAALRAAVAGIETYKDWELLKNRQRVVLLKTEVSHLSCLSDIKTFLGDDRITDNPSGKETINLNYENYLYLLMYLQVDASTLVQRTGTLITLNVNQAMREISEKDSELTSLEFNTKDAVTAVKSTCNVKMDFVILPDNFAEMYLSGSDAETVINKLESQYIGYSVIRGY